MIRLNSGYQYHENVQSSLRTCRHFLSFVTVDNTIICFFSHFQERQNSAPLVLWLVIWWLISSDLDLHVNRLLQIPHTHSVYFVEAADRRIVFAPFLRIEVAVQSYSLNIKLVSLYLNWSQIFQQKWKMQNYIMFLSIGVLFVWGQIL